MMEMFWILSTILIVLNVLDVITTHNAIKSGAGMEANLVMAWSMKVFGSAWWIPKTTLVVGPIIAAYLLGVTTATSITLAALIAFYAWIVINNYKIWKGL